jgi:hypothetical protein
LGSGATTGTASSTLQHLQKAGGPVIEPDADFLADAPPLVRSGFNRFGRHAPFNHRQMLGNARVALLCGRVFFWLVQFQKAAGRVLFMTKVFLLFSWKFLRTSTVGACRAK